MPPRCGDADWGGVAPVENCLRTVFVVTGFGVDSDRALPGDRCDAVDGGAFRHSGTACFLVVRMLPGRRPLFAGRDVFSKEDDDEGAFHLETLGGALQVYCCCFDYCFDRSWA